VKEESFENLRPLSSLARKKEQMIVKPKTVKSLRIKCHKGSKALKDHSPASPSDFAF
jgi:hypothetical protein